MQQLSDFSPHYYFAFGPASKSSIIAQFCRENNYVHLKNPIQQTLAQLQKKDTIIEGNIQLFEAAEKQYPELQVVFFGQPQNERQVQIKREYCSLGICKRVAEVNYSAFRKAMYPNLIFFYGPVKDQSTTAATTMAKNINYVYLALPKNANQIVHRCKKTCNYLVNGLFTSKHEIVILEEYFNIKIVHFQYNRVQLPGQTQFFDKEYQILNYLKSKPYYVRVDGASSPIQIMDQVGVGVCPELIYINRATPQHSQYIQRYIEETDGLWLSLPDIQSIRKRKNLPLVDNNQGRALRLTQILHKDLNRKRAILTDYPSNVSDEVIPFEHLNRKFSKYIDLQASEQYDFNEELTASMYFHEQQKRICPNQKFSLKHQLQPKIKYWIVNGPDCCGKTTVAKHIAEQYGYKLIEMETYMASLKQKLLGPDDGEQIPPKKVLDHFASLVRQGENPIIFDSRPSKNLKLEDWIGVVGAPDVLNLNVEDHQVILRTRKKNEGDLKAEVTEEQNAKMKQNATENTNWINKLSELSPRSRVFTVEYNKPKLIAQQAICAIMKPRVYLIQNNESLIYQNVALKFNMTFINLCNVELRKSLKHIKKSDNRDIMLCCYTQSQEGLVSDDMYWIEKHIGSIRYLGIWNPQFTDANEEKLPLERPVKEQPKPQQNAENGEEKPPEQAPKEGQEGAKKAFDIHDYEWTRPSNAKNLSQWFFKLKGHSMVIQRTNKPLECFKKFGEICEILDTDPYYCVYETIDLSQ